jgi:small-conductance mechanosensitive channel
MLEQVQHWLIVASNAPLQGDENTLDSIIDGSTLVGVVTVLVGSYVIVRVLSFLLSAAAERSPSRRLSIKMFIPVVKLIVYGTALYIVAVSLFQLTSTQVLAVSGLIGAALGFGLQDLVSALFAGLVLVGERPYQVGDKVELEDEYGEVVDIGVRATKLETLDDTTVVVPNDEIFDSSVQNVNDGTPEMMVTVDLAVTPAADESLAKEIVEDALVTSSYVYVDDTHPVSVLVSDEISYRQIRGRAYVADHRDELRFSSDVTERSIEAFDRAGIETPESPPLHQLGAE